jgi:hypothetical protein
MQAIFNISSLDLRLHLCTSSNKQLISVPHLYILRSKLLFLLPNHFQQPVLLPHHFQQGANFAISLVDQQSAIFATACLPRSKQAASFAAAPFPTRSQFCHHTFASFDQAPISGTTQLFLLPYSYQAAGFAVTLCTL